MKPKRPLTSDDLNHPNSSTYKAWNGDERKKRNTDRWSGAPDMEDTGWNTRGKVRTVEGTKSGSRVKPANVSVAPKFVSYAQPMAYSHPPTPAQRRRDELEEQLKTTKPLTPRQKSKTVKRPK